MGLTVERQASGRRFGVQGGLACWALLLAAPAVAAPQTLPDFCNARTPAEVSALVNHDLSCGFDRTSLSYAGSAVEQARCLARRVKLGGELADEAPLPAYLEGLIGQPVTVTPAKIRAYLAGKQIAEADVGGPVSAPVSKTASGVQARYFVIHDTSWPNFLTQPFPAVIDSPDWKYNKLARYRRGDDSGAHIFIARTGASTTAVPYARGWRATKVESCVLLTPSRGLFLHHELVQPRRSDPDGRSGNDRFSPEPPLQAVTDRQLERLALLYAVASVRAGHWLIPAFHTAIDEGLDGGHDDPQGFRIDKWAADLKSVNDDIAAMPSGG